MRLNLAVYLILLSLGDSSSGFDESVNVSLRAAPPVTVNQTQSKATCPFGWSSNPNNTKCFKYVAGNNSWHESERRCASGGGHLAAATSPQELTLLQQTCSENSNTCWVGGRLVDGVWNWSDNTSFSNTAVRLAMPGCANLSCTSNNSTNLCTLIVDGSISLVVQGCDLPHPFLCMLHLGNRCRGMRCHPEYLIVLAAASGLILFATLAVVSWLLLIHKHNKTSNRSPNESDPAELSSWKMFTPEELKSITKNFSEGNRLLGDAKTGGTYSGLLPDGSRVAVKRLKRSGFQRKNEFYSEISRVARLHHPNLVAVRGCCYDHGDRYIVYEFIANGPLDRWLHHVPRGGRTLDWAARMRIATSLAQGIAFLHDKVKPQVVHRDIRATNVLLDEHFGAHLMGVGLSNFVPWGVVTHERRAVAGGTHGYLAPEFVYRNEQTTKSDVYSFGVLLLEIVSGRRPAAAAQAAAGPVDRQSVFEWATPLVQAHRYVELLDPAILASGAVPEGVMVQRVVDLVYACTQVVPSVRPRMSHVVHQLQQVASSTTK